MAPAQEMPSDIASTVASLPADKMFEFMTQIKTCIENNAEEAESMLLQNPPLIYLLLNAQLAMGLVDLHQAADRLATAQSIPLPDVMAGGDDAGPSTSAAKGSSSSSSSRKKQQQQRVDEVMDIDDEADDIPPPMVAAPPTPVQPPPVAARPVVAPSGPPVPPMQMPMMFTEPPPPIVPTSPAAAPASAPSADPRLRRVAPGDPRSSRSATIAAQQQQQQHHQQPPPVTVVASPPQPQPAASPAADKKPRDPRLARRAAVQRPQQASAPVPAPVPAPDPDEEERTNLIMQVLQLTEEQIAMLPQEQREGVLQLREQIRLQNGSI